MQNAVVWLSKLALLTGGGRSPLNKQQIGLYAETLAGEIPTAAFCDASLKVISEGAEFFPTYRVLREALTTWYGQHGALAVAARSEPGYGLQDWLLDRIMTECGNQRGQMLRSWLETKGVDVDAVVAQRAATQARADWSDPAKVRASVAKLAGHPMERALGNLLAPSVARHAPDNLAFVPAEFHPGEGRR